MHYIFIIISTIVENAVKHGLRPKKEGGEITVSLKKRVNQYIISIADNGIGIDADNLANIQKQLKNSSTAAAGEIGIGLINVNTRLIDILGTRLTINSVLGEGTVVSFEI